LSGCRTSLPRLSGALAGPQWHGYPRGRPSSWAPTRLPEDRDRARARARTRRALGGDDRCHLFKTAPFSSAQLRFRGNLASFVRASSASFLFSRLLLRLDPRR
jgi:hypothetical protein